jgi:predicted metalloprotease
LLGLVVLLAALFLPKLLGSGPSTAGVTQPVDRTGAAAAEPSCSSDLEQIVCGATDDVQNYWKTNMPAFFGGAYTPTKTVLFTDAVDTGCGQATSQTGPFYCPIDHLVYIDRVHAGTRTAVDRQAHRPRRAVHPRPQYRHHIQNLVGPTPRCSGLSRRPGRANQYSVAMELQADATPDVGRRRRLAWVARFGRRDQ